MTDSFDRDELMDRVDGDMEFLEETLEMYDEDAPGLLEEIRAAAGASDAAAIVTPAHTLKGMLSNFCAGPAHDIARDIETRGRGGSAEGLVPAVETLGTEMDRLRADLKAFLGEGTP